MGHIRASTTELYSSKVSVQSPISVRCWIMLQLANIPYTFCDSLAIKDIKTNIVLDTAESFLIML